MAMHERSTSWDEIGYAELPSGIKSYMYRIGDTEDPEAPTVFQAWFPPDCVVESHTHACDYSEIILEGAEQVGRTWYHPGDIRIGEANKVYGPLRAGPEGVLKLVIFKTGAWHPVTVGSNTGATLGEAEIVAAFEK